MGSIVLNIRVKLDRVRRVFGVDRAVAYTLLYRGWQILAGGVTLFFVAHFLTPVEQGFYYTFSSVLGLQVFFELGLTFVVMQFASHEKAHLVWAPNRMLEGDPIALQRLRSLLRLAMIWYSVASVLILAILLPVGLYFFSKNPDAAVIHGWQFPWAWLVVITAGNLLIGPFLAILEGCGLVAEVASMRVVQDFIAYGSLWLGLIGGWGLLAAPLLGTLRFGVSAIWLVVSKRQLLYGILQGPVNATFNWWREVWPVQWKIALSWVSGYLIFQLFNPVLFAFWGAASAGRMGMSLTITTAINTMSFSWMNTKSPIFGQFIARREYQKLDHLFFRTLRQTIGIGALGGFIVWIVVLVLYKLHSPLAQRIMDPLPFGILTMASIVNIVIFSEAIYLRAHKKEPFLWNSIICAMLTALSTYFLGRYYGAVGMVIGYFCIVVFIGLSWGTWIFINKRCEWHEI